jgi:Ca-activated chloride channel family protein
VTFATPLALLAIPAVLILLAAYVWWRRRRPAAAVPFPDVDLVAMAAPPPRKRRFIPLVLAALALVGFAFALARPEVTRQVPREEATVMLAIDVSGSMAASDVEPYRLAAAQEAARIFADTVPRQFQVGLVAFSGEAAVLVPPTTDRLAFNRALQGLVADGATAFGDAVMASLDAIQRTQPGAETLRSARILLLSDGANTVGTLPEDAARRAKELGVPVFTVALGTQDGVLADGRRVPPDPEALAALAETTGGRTFESEDAGSVKQVYEDLGTFIGTREIQDEVTAWPAGIAALLLAFAGLAAWRVGPRLP